MKEIMAKLANENSDLETILGSLVVLEEMTRTLMNILSASAFFKEHDENLSSYSFRIVQGAFLMIEKSEGSQKEQFSLIIKYCVEALCKLVERLIESKASQPLVAMFSQEKGILELLTGVLLFPMMNEPRLIFEVDPTSPVQIIFNEAKGATLETFKKLLNNLFIKYPPRTKLSTLKFHGRLVTLVAEINESMYQFRRISKAHVSALHQSVEKVITPSLNIIAKTIEIHDFYNIYAGIFKNLIIEVLLPELLITPQEKESFIDNEVEFVNLAFDTCFDQKSKVPKVLAMKSIENLCDKIDGALSFTAIGALTLADAVLSQKSEAEVLSEVPSVEPFMKSHLVKNHSAEEVLDICLLVITSISYHIVKRADLL